MSGEKPFVLCLTGSLGMGKSRTASFFAEAGVPVHDSDAAVHELYEGEAVPLIERAFPGATAAGKVDRAKLAAMVLGDAAAIAKLEAIVHPFVYETILNWFEAGKAPIGVASIPLLYETHREGDFDAVVVTACKADQQLERMIERGMSEVEARRRMAAQMPAAEKAARADHVIWTGGTTHETDVQVEELLIKLGRRLSTVG